MTAASCPNHRLLPRKDVQRTQLRGNISTEKEGWREADHVTGPIPHADHWMSHGGPSSQGVVE